MKRPGRLSYAGVAAALVLVPIIADLVCSDRKRVFGYLAPDAFYYLTVGRNFAEHGVLAFDQAHPTNGYHPLWQLTVAALFTAARRLGIGDPAVLVVVILLEAALVAAALLLLASAMRVSGRRGGLGLLTLPVGAYALVILPLWSLPGARHHAQEGELPLFGTLWNDVNGMETGLLVFAVGLVSRLLVDAPLSSGRRAAAFGGALAALTLSRLDHGVFALALLAMLASAGSDAPARRHWVLAFLTFAVPIGAYLALNRVLVGTALPVSGVLKSSFPHPTHANLRQALQLVRGDRARTLGDAARQAQMLLPALVAILYHLRRLAERRRVAAPADVFVRLLDALAMGTVLLAAYNFLFVRPGNQWHWYYPVSILFVGLLAARTLDRILPPSSRAAPVVAIAIVAGTLVVFVTMHRRVGCHRAYADFYFDEGPDLRARYAGDEPRLVEYDDGIVAFTTGFPTMSGTGLSLDPEAAGALREGRLLPLALARGFDCVTGFIYQRPFVSPVVGSNQPQAVAAYGKRLVGAKDADEYRFSVDYYSERSRFAILRVARARDGTLNSASPRDRPSTASAATSPDTAR